MNEPIQIAIVEDNHAFAKSLRKMMEISGNLSCSACFSNAEDCVSALKSEASLEADVILLDLHLPGKNGLTLVPILRQTLPEADIIVLTQNDNYLTTLEAIRLGVSGYILKDSSIAEIRNAIADVHAGASVIDPQLSRIVLNALSSDESPENNVLSTREKQVLELMAMGYVKKEVADKLDLSYRTVAQYTENIYKKLQVPNVAAAVATAIRKGLI